MSTLLKNVYDKKYINTLSSEVKKYYSKFNQDKFIKEIFNTEWKNMELKERLHHISRTLGHNLPKDYSKALKIITQIAPKFGGYAGMFAPAFVELYGLSEKNKDQFWQQSLDALKELTKYSSSEFAIRPFIQEKPKEVMAILQEWSQDSNEHVRRLSSEGCRPRLPWATALESFKKKPSLILPILNNLKSDSSEYVRRSVANNINDISKDHTKVALDMASRWVGQSADTDRLIKHGLRTLLKAGAPGALKLFGYLTPKQLKIKVVNFKSQKKVKLGHDLKIEGQIETLKPSKVRLEFGLYFLRKNGEHNLKVFKINEKQYAKGKHLINKTYSFKKISTRKYYRGQHFVSLIINGVEVKKISFELY